MKVKTVLPVVSFFIFAYSLMFLASSPVAFAEAVELKFSHPYSAMHPQQKQAFEPWAKQLEELSGGRLKVTFVPDGVLGKPSQVYQAVEIGIADIGWDVSAYNADKFPLTSVFSLPFMVNSGEQGATAMWRTLVKSPGLQNEYANFKVLSINCHTPGSFATVKMPIQSLSDLKGMKIIESGASTVDALVAFGAKPETFPITEYYNLLKVGVVDGVILPFDGVYTFKLHEVLKYYTPIGIFTGFFWVSMNKAKFDSLSDDLKTVIDQVSGEPLSRQCGRVFDEGDAYGKKVGLDAGMQEIILPDAEMQKLRTILKPQQEKWVNTMEAKGLPGAKVMATALAEIEAFEK